MKYHPEQEKLALFSGGDLSVFEMWRVRHHLNSCETCRREVDGFRLAAHELVVHGNRPPAGVEWERLAAEMGANIRLGLEAGECVARRETLPVGTGRWRAAVVMATVSALVLGAWAFNPAGVPKRPEPLLRAASVAEIRNTSTGLELNNNGGALVLLHGRNPSQKPIIVSAPGALRARFVDSDTGQITITHVYAD
ncbi:MAG TPA: hypothetical protein VES20_24965 [Bryobacteraceae bacterium]|nr:hypothetical protein [Bryobacteraceae bacterium]